MKHQRLLSKGKGLFLFEDVLQLNPVTVTELIFMKMLYFLWMIDSKSLSLA